MSPTWSVTENDVIAGELVDFVAHVTTASTAVELESRYLDRIGSFVTSSAAGLYLLHPATRQTQSISARGVSDFFLSRYEERGRHDDPVLRCAISVGHAVDNSLLMAPEEWSALPVYAEVFHLHRMAHLLEAPIIVDDEVVGTLNFGRTTREGRFAERDRRVADAVARLLGAALVALRSQTELTRQRNQALAALELCTDAVVVTDLRHAQRRMNRAAERLLGRVAEGEAALEALMTQAPIHDGEISRRQAEVTCADGRRASLVVRSVHPDGDAAVTVSHVQLLGAHETAAVLPDELTAREQEVAQLAARGLRDAEIAARLCLSRYTVKQYLKSVYAKLGIRSRVELARLAALRWEQ